MKYGFKKGVKIMKIDEQIQVEKEKEYLVVKDNRLIQKSRFELTLPEQKAVAYIVSKIQPISAKDKALGTPYILDYDFDIRQFCKICGIDYNNGKNYADVKAMLQKLSDRSMWVEIGDEDVLCRWLAKVRTNKRSGNVHVRLDEDLAPYLFALSEKYTAYQLGNIMQMKSAYSVRIYELAKSYKLQRSKKFAIDEFKKILSVENVKSYSNFKDFRKRVLEVAETEINDMTDINIKFEPQTKGRKVVAVEMFIQEKKNFKSPDPTFQIEFDKWIYERDNGLTNCLTFMEWSKEHENVIDV